MTVTVAHYPEVQKWGLERYLGVDLKWRVFRGDIDRGEVVEAMSRQDDEEQEVVESEAANADDEQQQPQRPDEIAFRFGLQRRSRGTVQHDYVEWQQHLDHYSANDYTLAIAAYKRWQRNVSPVRVGIVVRIEDLGRSAPIYTRIAEMLAEIETRGRA